MLKVLIFTFFCMGFSFGNNPPRECDNNEGRDKQQWDYKCNGPDVWQNTFPKCGGSSQSPINIDRSNLQLGQFSELTFVNYSLEMKDLTIENIGSTVQVNLNQENPPYIVGGGLPTKYNLVQFHFHWGQKDSEGSETTIDGIQYPLELHLVHANSEIALEDAKKQSDGLAVLAVLFHKKKFGGKFQSSHLPEAVTDAVGNAADFEMSTTFSATRGSLTTPSCAEAVIWTVFAETVPVTQAQLAAFRKVKDSDNEVLERNFRPVQGLNGRTVLYTADSENTKSQKVSSSESLLVGKRAACSFSCKGLPNADYPDPCGPPCSPIYYTCWNERAEQQRCSVGQDFVFDSTQGTCVDIQWCTPPPPAPVVTFLGSYSCQLFGRCSFECKGLPNGDYGDPCVNSCAQSYYTCWNGQAERQRCSPGAAFDANKRKCVDKQWCEPKCESSLCKRISSAVKLKFYLICTRVGSSGDNPNDGQTTQVIWA